MNINFKELEEKDRDSLISFLAGGYWPFHSSPKLTAEKLNENYTNGYFNGSGKRTFIIFDENEIAGVIRLFDLGENTEDDETPLFDIKISESHRSKGIGKNAVKWLCDLVFNTYPNKNRFEATTRIDNLAMRKVLESCGFVKEAHYRQAWPDINGNKFDCAGYSILRKDWVSNMKTPVDFSS